MTKGGMLYITYTMNELEIISSSYILLSFICLARWMSRDHGFGGLVQEQQYHFHWTVYVSVFWELLLRQSIFIICMTMILRSLRKKKKTSPFTLKIKVEGNPSQINLKFKSQLTNCWDFLPIFFKPGIWVNI